MHVDPHDWPRLSALLDEALDLGAAQLPAWLAMQTAQQPDIAEALRDLLARRAAVETGDFMAALPALPDLASAGGEAAGAPGPGPGGTIGPYRLERQIGAGGAGVVWLASGQPGSAHGAPSRAVALKLFNAGAYGPDLLERFARERDILASLEHPGIARLYDAGIAAGGQPWLALEYVEGQPLDAWCDARRLPLRERLMLFRQVLEAVAFAHSRLVIHRDLKPSNILVTTDGKARLLDFGVAKLLRPPQPGAQPMTEMTTRFMTPRYAAPEQVTGQAMSTATDIYSLGVVLYELLCGQSPYRTTRASRGALEEAIVEVDPLPPSRAVVPEQAQLRAGSAPRLQSALRGDLDTIVLKALKKQPDERYATVDALLLDMDNHLAGVPVQAHADSAWYRIGKFVRRHRAVTALTTALLLALLLGVAGVGWQAVRAREAAALAKREAARAELQAQREKATKDFLVGVFSAADPRLPGDRPRTSIPAGELLVASAGRIEKDFANDPDTAIELLGMVGEILDSVEDVEHYRPLHARYVQLMSKRYGESDPRTLAGQLDEADAMIDGGETAAATALLARTDGLIHSAGLDRTKARALWWLTRANLLRGQSATSPERATALRNAIALYAAVAPGEENYAQALSSLGGLLYRQDDDDGAIGLYRQAIGVLQASKGPAYAELGALYLNRADAEEEKGDFPEAFADFARSLAIMRATYGEQNPRYAGIAAEEARLQHWRGQRARADVSFEAMLARAPLVPAVYTGATLGQIAAVIREDYASCLLAEGRPGLAIPLLQQVLQIYKANALFSDYREGYSLHLALGSAYADVGRTGDAQRELSAVVARLAAARPADAPMLLAARERWGRLLEQLGRAREAAAQWREVLAQAHARDIAPVARALSDLSERAVAQGQAQRALELGARALQVGAHALREPEIRLGPQLWSQHAHILLRTGDARGALEWARRAAVAEREYDDPASGELARTEATLRAAQAALPPQAP